jgi:hypothetical protein
MKPEQVSRPSRPLLPLVAEDRPEAATLLENRLPQKMRNRQLEMHQLGEHPFFLLQQVIVHKDWHPGQFLQSMLREAYHVHVA